MNTKHYVCARGAVFFAFGKSYDSSISFFTCTDTGHNF